MPKLQTIGNTALMAKPEVEQAKNEIQQYIANLPMTVKSQAESEAAAARITEVRAELKRREKWFDDNILSHSKKAYDEAKKAYDAQKVVKVDLLRPMKDWVQQTDANNLAWIRAEKLRIAQAQADANRKYEANRAKAEEKGKDPDGVKPPKLYTAPTKTVKSEAGGYTVVERKVLNVFDESKIPEQFWKRIRNDSMIEAALRAGLEVPGARLEIEYGSAVRG